MDSHRPDTPEDIARRQRQEIARLDSKIASLRRERDEAVAGRLSMLRSMAERLGDTEELTYALMCEAVARGTERWKHVTGRVDVLPDLAELTSWLLSDMDSARTDLAAAVGLLKDAALAIHGGPLPERIAMFLAARKEAPK